MTYPKPSNGSLICTFADCPDRKEDIQFWRQESSIFINAGYCPLGARVNDYSECLNENSINGRDDNSGCLYKYCEVAVRCGVCPRGFTR